MEPLSKGIKRPNTLMVKDPNMWNDKLSIWLSPEYIQRSKDIFNKIETYLQNTNAKFNNIMDIGCGIAQVPQHFQNKYGSKLYLLEGSYTDKNSFYGTLEDVDFQLCRQGITNYTLIDILNKQPVKEKMDLIFSFLAVGHHFDVKDWIQWIKEHSTNETKIILDLRKKSMGRRCKGLDIVEVIEEKENKFLAEVKII